jgi:hypothetical protein
MKTENESHQRDFINFIEDMPHNPSLKKGFLAAITTRNEAAIHAFFMKAGYIITPGVIASILTNMDNAKKLYVDSGY